MIRHWTRPFVHFLKTESASGIVLLACTAVALVLANSPWSAAYAQFWHTPVGVFALREPLEFWVNDGLMTIFFFVVGLEIKRELVTGELREPRKAVLPVVAALGGMLVPALIYLSIERGGPGHAGWGIPVATDIAFVVGFLALLGRRVPFGLKILLLSLAIADDIGAVIVIAVAYSGDLSLVALGLGGAGFGAVCVLRWVGVRWLAVYAVVAVGIWLAFLNSGVHPTVAGVLLGLLTPARGSFAPLERLERTLHPWVAFGIMPIFALANAGVSIQPADLQSPVAHAVAAGLILGKPLGIALSSWGAVKLGLARLPGGVNWHVLVGAGSLAGIGFTMSLFIAQLALPDNLLDAGKIGVLAGSTISAVLGSLLLLYFLPAPAPPADGKGDRGLE
jgi:NhaA family Na+:H+ antiporter